MSLSSIAAMLGAMLVLASVPDASAFAVVGRSMASGFAHGLVTTLGILAGDFIFIGLSVYGLSSIAETMGGMFVFIKYLGAAYLIWLGISLWRSETRAIEIEGINELSWASNFLCGFFVTLGDPKTILFYVSFLPAFLDLSRASIFDIGIIMAMATVALFSIKLGYAYMADRARLLFCSPGARKRLDIAAGSVMIGTGLFLVAKA